MKYESLTEMWHDALQLLLNAGRSVYSRVGGSVEFINWHGTLLDIDQNFLLDEVRAADPSYAAAEFLWYARAESNVGMLLNYAPSYIRFAEEDGCAHGAYGPRIMHNIPEVISLLRKHPETRQAVLLVWKPTDIKFAHQVNDMPCTVSLQFILREDKLHCVGTMRSNDIWLGVPYDVFAFTMIQRLIADELGVKYGLYHHNVGSLHLYDKNKDDATQCKLPNGERLSHSWDNRFRLDDLENAVMFEEKMRQTDGGYIPFKNTPSASNDMLICCTKKLHPEWIIDPYSPLLKAGFDLKQQRDKRRRNHAHN